MFKVYNPNRVAFFGTSIWHPGPGGIQVYHFLPPTISEVPKVTMTSSEVLRFLRSTMNSEPCLWSLGFFVVEATRSWVYPTKMMCGETSREKNSFFGGGMLAGKFTFSKTRKTRMNDTNLHYDLLIHVSCSLRTSYLPIRVRFGRGQILTCPKNKIPHFQGFKRNEVHNSS